jgi:RimJ/RimL family protein N-acetyltransferase
MLLCQLEGRIVGMCRFSVNPRRKIRHRGEVIIFLSSSIWGQGVGSAMFRAMFDAARAMGLTQLELGFVEGNDRARALYEKMGFTFYGRLPNAFRLLDGSFRDECLMIKTL